ncbi:MAG TPA: NAD(P)/FAD-dependent oxidoreductase [Pseudonocardiaceae bacterium]|nr:NAD(P)/FAD-dependent oxidoreductase [Pseudonocardiaceae bacterium]
MAKTWEVAIVGAGFSGLGMAIQLKKAGRHDFVILEEAGDVGGTWRENTYPGCACDIPSHLYSYSFEPNPGWTRQYPRQQEIWDYLRHCTRKYGLEPHLRFRTRMVTAEFDDTCATWLLTTDGGETVRARALVGAFGPLHHPAIPDLPGLDRFAGATFHSARWDHDYDLAGKRVAVIGTGSSAIQFVPEIAPEVAHLEIFQRTAPWIMPKPDREITGFERRLFRLFPPARRAFRNLIYWRQEVAALGFVVNPRLMRLIERLARRHIERHVRDPALRAAVTPSYVIGCKRILISNDYYRALNRPNVDLTTSPIVEVREHGVVTADGTEHRVDAIIFGTGFRVIDALASKMIVGANGRKLQDAWADGPQAYRGITIAGFPNLFLLVGPNTGLGHNSIVFMIETQIRHVLRCLRELDRGRTIDVRAGAERDFNHWVQSRLRGTVWQTGCKSWYLDDEGRNRTLWPGFTFTYWWRTRTPRLSDYEVVAR